MPADWTTEITYSNTLGEFSQTTSGWLVTACEDRRQRSKLCAPALSVSYDGLGCQSRLRCWDRRGCLVRIEYEGLHPHPLQFASRQGEHV